MIIVEILIAIGIACIATALLETLMDKDQDEEIGARNQLVNKVEGAEEAQISPGRRDLGIRSRRLDWHRRTRSTRFRRRGLKSGQ